MCEVFKFFFAAALNYFQIRSAFKVLGLLQGHVKQFYECFYKIYGSKLETLKSCYFKLIYRPATVLIF